MNANQPILDFTFTTQAALLEALLAAMALGLGIALTNEWVRGDDGSDVETWRLVCTAEPVRAESDDDD